MTSQHRITAALTLTLCCLAACGPQEGGNDDKRGRDPLQPGSDPCANVDPAQCESTKGCALVTACPDCAPGSVCPAMCAVSCQSVSVPPVPPPSLCDGLDEATCKATRGCEPFYGGVCPMCVSGTNCPPCTTGFLGCGEVKPPPPSDPCVGLDERSCNMKSGCQGVYSVCPPNALCACPAGADCYSEPTIFTACQQDAVVCGGGGSTPGAPPPPAP